MAPTWLGRVNRPWHRPCPSSAIVNRHASSASASWRCSAWSSWSSAISGATTSRTWCASRRSATGSCSAARPIRCASAFRRCSTGNASTPVTITTACSSETLSGGHRVPDRLVVVVQGVARGPGGAWRRVWSAGWCWPSSCSCRRRRGSAPRSRRSACWAWRELELGDLVPQRGQRGQVGVGLGGRQGPQGEVGDLAQLSGDGGDRGRDRVLPGVVECRCHTGNSGIGHRQSRAWNGVFRAAVEKYFENFLEPSDVVVSRRRPWRASSTTTAMRAPRRVARHPYASGAAPFTRPRPATARRRCRLPCPVAGGPQGTRLLGARWWRWTYARTSSSSRVTTADRIAAPSMCRPTSTIGRSVKYCTKPSAPCSTSTSTTVCAARIARGSACVARSTNQSRR